MTGTELEALRERLGLSQEAMADQLQCDAVGYRRYATGVRPVPRYIARSAQVLGFVQQQGLMGKLKKTLHCSQWLHILKPSTKQGKHAMSIDANEYPELAKMDEVQEQSQSIGDFIDWLHENGMSICKTEEGLRGGTYWPVMKTPEQLLADYYKIDLRVVEVERRKILASLNPA